MRKGLPMAKASQGSGHIRAFATGHVQAVSRHNLSSNHLWAASHFAFLAGEIEHRYEKAAWGEALMPFYREHQAYVTGCVTSTSSFLESLINEMFKDAEDRSPRLGSIDHKFIEIISGLWSVEHFRSHAKILEKYQTYLCLTSSDTFSTDGYPYRDVKLMLDIRNSLVHFKPEYGSSELDQDDTQRDPHKKLTRSLRGKFSHNKIGGLASTGNPFFPMKCLGFGCAEWSVRSAISFVDEFCLRLGVTSPIDGIRGSLKVK
jgi:hypothetical protein